MDNTINAILRSIIEAITEFLPVSSTGHLFLFSYFFPFSDITNNKEEFEDLFDIFIQSGAILSVLVLYFDKFKISTLDSIKFIQGDRAKRSGFDFLLSILIGSIPILIIGFLLKNFLDGIKASSYLLTILGCTWLLGGIGILIQERIFQNKTKLEDASLLKNEPHPPILENHQNHYPILSIKNSLIIGFVQCIALLPGVSRSLATIVAGRSIGLSKKHAAEYSFYLAVPVLIAAGVYKLYKYRNIIEGQKLFLLLLGSILSFLLCILVIRLFLSYIRRHSFSIFGYYRIVLGLIVLCFTLI
jgi:undecaprenyl-diphosphatase